MAVYVSLRMLTCVLPFLQLIPATPSDQDARYGLELAALVLLLILLASVRDEEVLASVMAGASGYIAMNSRRSELIRAIHIAAGGGSYFESGTVDRVIGRLQDMNSVADVDGPDALTEREVLILNMIAEGFSNEKISTSLDISTRTARNNITELRGKLDLHSRTQLAAYAARREVLHELHLKSNS